MEKEPGGSNNSIHNEYESMRDSHISKNNAFLRSLNLEPILQSLNTNGATTKGGVSSHVSKNTTKARHPTITNSPIEAAVRRASLRPRTTRNDTQNDIDMQDEIPDYTNEEFSQGAEVSKKRRGRGHTRKENIWSRENEPLIKITFNEYGQPVGKAAKDFPNVVGSIVRTKGFPLSHEDWRDVDTNVKQRLIDALECIYEMDEKLEDYALATAAKKWKDFKSDLKKEKFDESKTDEELLAACDSRVDKEEWAWLIKYWRSPEAQARSARGKANRAMVGTPHTAGSKSFARVGYEWSEKNGRKPYRHELFVLTHTRKDGVHLKQAEPKIIALHEAATKYPELKDKTIKDGDLFSHVFGREPRGHVRSVGLGPTPSSLGIPGHRKYTPTKIQMALRGRRKAEQEVTFLKEEMEQMKGQIQELRAMVLAGQSRGEAAPNLDSPIEHGSNPTPNRVGGCDYDSSETDEESYPEVSNIPTDGHEIMRRRAAIPTRTHEGVWF